MASRPETQKIVSENIVINSIYRYCSVTKVGRLELTKGVMHPSNENVSKKCEAINDILKYTASCQNCTMHFSVIGS